MRTGVRQFPREEEEVEFFNHYKEHGSRDVIRESRDSGRSCGACGIEVREGVWGYEGDTNKCSLKFLPHSACVFLIANSALLLLFRLLHVLRRSALRRAEWVGVRGKGLEVMGEG